MRCSVAGYHWDGHMIRFEVINSEEYWDVVGFNPDNPSAKVLANRSYSQAYAEMLAADLNGLDEIEPTTAVNQPEAAREERPKRQFLVELDKPRSVRFGD
jgi:hypothetical protein